MPPASSSYVSITNTKHVAMDTMSFSSIHRRHAFASQCVLTTRDRFQMGGIHTAWNLAEMVDFQSPRDWSNEQFITNAMSHRRGTCSPQLPVAISGVGSAPYPAIGLLIHLRPEAFFKCLQFGSPRRLSGWCEVQLNHNLLCGCSNQCQRRLCCF